MMKVTHEVVMKLPEHERYDLASQMRRASKSVPANIVEGYAKRAAPKEFARALSMALGSANEMEAHFKIARDLGYLSADESARYIAEYEIIGRQLRRLMQYWRSKPRETT